MLRLLLRWVLSALVFVLIAELVPGIRVDTLTTAFVAAIVAGLLNVLVRPVLVFLTLPITLITLGLFLLVVNAVIFWLTAVLVPGFHIDGVGPAIIGALLYWLLNVGINHLFERPQEHKAA